MSRNDINRPANAPDNRNRGRVRLGLFAAILALSGIALLAAWRNVRSQENNADRTAELSDELSDEISATVNRLDVMLDKVNAGQGTIGQLLVIQQLYDNLNGTAQEMHGLMKDFRANPKKFLRIKLSLF